MEDERYSIRDLGDGYGFAVTVYGANHYSCAYVVRSKGDPKKVAERNARAPGWGYGWNTLSEAEEAVEKHKKQFPKKQERKW